MEAIISPLFSVVYAGKDITKDVTQNMISVTYSDRLQGQSDEVELVLDDTDGKWSNDWYPEKGDQIDLELGYEDMMVACGRFEIDEVEIQGPPSTITIRALAAGINSPLRTKRSQAHEDQTLKQLAETVASRHGLTVVDGTISTTKIKVNFASERPELTAAAAAIRNAITVNKFEVYRETVRVHYPGLLAAADRLTTKGRAENATEIRQTVQGWRAIWEDRLMPDFETTRQHALNFATKLDTIAASLKDIDQTITRSKLDVQLARITQNREHDLEFLRRISMMYGVIFTIRGNEMIFTSMYDIEAGDSSNTYNRGDLMRYSMKDKATKTYTKARVQYHNPAEKKDITAEVNASDLPEVNKEVVSKDELVITDKRVESEAQAMEVAKAALYHANSKTAEATIDLPGAPTLVAGVNILLLGLGAMSGTWHVTESQHRIDKTQGYVTSAQLKRIQKK